MAAIMLQVKPTFLGSYTKNSSYIFINGFGSIFLGKNVCFGHHDRNMCFLPKRKYQIILLDDVGELLQKLDELCILTNEKK